jgi:hypothetical protein
MALEFLKKFCQKFSIFLNQEKEKELMEKSLMG